MNRIDKSRQNGGFSLIEVLIAMLIFAIGILAIASMQLAAMKGNDVAREMSEAVNIGMDRLENFMLIDYNSTLLTPNTVHTATQGKYTISWTVTRRTPATPSTDNKTINMQVIWTDNNGMQRRANINHIVAEINQ